MLHRLSLWVLVSLFLAASSLRGQAPTSPSSASLPMPPGQIVAKQVAGKVSVRVNGTTSELRNDEAVSQSAVVTTAANSSAVLVFSNGATAQLGPETTLMIEEFLQDPFQGTLTPANLTSEPTRSRTRLKLSQGELVGKVAHLNHNQGSSFTVQTPVGAAGIRGTTFRIVFRPAGTGQAFVFSLSTVEGNVNLQQGVVSSPVGAPSPAPTPGNAPDGGAAPSGASGVAVIGGQEVVVTVSATVNPQTGQLVFTALPTVTSTQPISLETQTAIVQQAQTLIEAATTATFNASTGGSGGSNSGPNTSDGATSGTSSGSSSGSGAASGTGSTLPQPLSPPVPAPTQPPQVLTPGAGRPS